MAMENRKSRRFQFEHAYPARIMAIDGTWQRNCLLCNVSSVGAKVIVDGSVDRLTLDEFFLLLSSNGTAHRRCQMVWLRGDQIGIRYVESSRVVEPAPRKAASIHKPDAEQDDSRVWIV